MTSFENAIAMFGLPGGSELFVIAIFGLLLFGKRLPEVGKSMGRSIVEFKKGLKGIEDEIESAGEDRDMLPPPSETKQSETTTTEQHKEAV